MVSTSGEANEKRDIIEQRAEHLFSEQQQRVFRRTDRVLAILMMAQWAVGVLAALFFSSSPSAIEQTNQKRIWTAVFLGGAVILLPIVLALKRPGQVLTRHSIAVGQMLISSLLIHLTGGSIEAHFHLFGSLAFLSLYRDWRVLVSASSVVVLDHLLRSSFFSRSLFGVLPADEWQWLGYSLWAAFLNIFLIFSSFRSEREMRQNTLDTARLEASEEQYRLLIENANDIIYRTDLRGCFTFINPVAERIFGQPATELIGRRFSELAAPEECEKIIEFYRKQFFDETPLTYFEYSVVTKDNSRIWLGQNVQLWRENGRITGYQSIARDITARVKAKRALSESEARYRAVADSASDAIITIDETNTILFANRATEEIFGYELKELIGASLLMLLPERMRAAHNNGIKRYLSTGKPSIPWHMLEVPAQHKEGHEFPIELSFGEYKVNEKHLFTAIVRDTTERTRIEEIAKRSREYQNLFKHANDAIIIFAPEDERVLDANDRACKMYGFTREEFVGRSIKEISKDTSHGDHQLAKLLADGTHNEFETVQYCRDGTPINLLVNSSVIEFQGRPAVLSINRDITERKRAEEELRRSQERFELVTRATNEVVWDCNLITNELNWNSNLNLKEHFGYITSELPPHISTWHNMVHPEDRERVLSSVAAALKSRAQFWTCEYRLHCRDGSIADVLDRALIIYKDGNPVRMVGSTSNITERKQAVKALDESKQMLQLVMDTIPQAIWWKDWNGAFIGCNRHLAEAAGFRSPDDLIGLTDYDLPWTKEEANFYRACDLQVMQTGVAQYHVIEPQTQADGKQAWLDTSKVPLCDVDGKIVGVLGTFQDVTERKRTDAALRESEEKFRTLLERMSEGLLQVDSSDCIQFVNTRFCEMTGFSQDELVGKIWSNLLLDDAGREFLGKVNERGRAGISDRYEIKMQKKTGEIIWTLVGGAQIYNADGMVTGSMGVFTDITERKHAEDQLLHNALHDALTGLPNRALFLEHLRRAIDRSVRRTTSFFAVLFLDFDRFKIVNDSLGHMEGDKLLIMIGRRLEASLRSGDIVARLGGDEFTILLDELSDERDVLRIVERIQQDMKEPFALAGREVFTSASIGIALSTPKYVKPEEMLRDADIAMYRAKATGKARHQVFNSAMHEQASTKLQLETEFRRAVERREFRVYYQPIVQLQDHQIIGFEALVRWSHPERGVISPAEFIPLAEETGLIVTLGEWVLRESCRQLHEWQTQYRSQENLTVSVNLSCKQFLQTDLAERVAEILSDTKLQAEHLRLEITESHVMEDSQIAITIMNRLRALGVKLSIDDFGTGYSSLSYLHRLPINYLKIDRSFVSRMQPNHENSEIVRTIIMLAENLEIEVIAEGIETAEQAQQLIDLNCRFGQGYLFSKPADAEQASALVKVGLFANSASTEAKTFNLDLIG